MKNKIPLANRRHDEVCPACGGPCADIGEAVPSKYPAIRQFIEREKIEVRNYRCHYCREFWQKASSIQTEPTAMAIVGKRPRPTRWTVAK